MECGNCKKPAKLACSSCKASPAIEDDPPVAHYCGADCQRADFAKHKPTCQRLKDRQKLYRVAQLTQKMFLIFKELTWCGLKLEAIEKSGQSMVLRGRKLESSTWPGEYTVFPSHLVSSEEDRLALLCYHSCVEAIIWVVEFCNGFLKDIITKAEHVEFYTKNDKLSMSLVPPGRNIFIIGGPTHEIIKVTLRSGEMFAFDITGAQYGYPDIIIPWTPYQNKRVLEIVETLPPPKCNNLFQVDDYGLATLFRPGGKMSSVRERGWQIATEVIEGMNFHFLEWQADGNLSLDELWKLPERQFQLKMEDMVNFIDYNFNSIPGQVYFPVNGRRQAQTLRHGNWVHGK